MKKYEVLFFRSNPQHRNGGYETTRTYEVKNEKELNKKLDRECQCVYGGMTVIEIREVA